MQARANGPVPNGLIDQETATLMEKLYIENQYNAINKYNESHGDKEPDSRETIFSLQEMEDYIAYVKAASLAHGYKNLGIRVYQGGIQVGEKVFTTVFFAPTNNGNNSMDILCLDLGEYGRPPKAYNPNNG